MNTLNECYVIVVPSDRPDGTGRPIAMESFLDLELDQVELRAEKMRKQYGEAWVIRLPIMLSREIVRVAGRQNDVVSTETTF